MSWTETEFENLYEIPSKNGLTRPARVRGSGFKMINMGELFANDRIGTIDMELVPMNDKELSHMLVEKDDLLFARQSLVLSGAGKCSIVKDVDQPTTFESHIIRVRLNRKLSNPRFYYYYFKSPACRIKSIVTQGVQAGIRGNDLKKLSVHTPPIKSQNRITEVLEKYDDLIENNKRQIELLEESARQLYKEWFVCFRFPGHEHVKIIDGVPEGWVLGSVGDIAKVFSGFAFKSKDWLEEGNPVIKIRNITSNNTVDVSDCQCVDYNVAEKAVRFRLVAGDMLIAMTGATVGKVGLMPSSERSFYLNQRVGKFESKLGRDATPLLLSFFNSEKAQSSILNLAGGAAQPNISAKQIESIELPIPTKAILNSFLDETDNQFSLRLNLIDQNFRLTQARDLLLPKLMRGEIAV